MSPKPMKTHGPHATESKLILEEGERKTVSQEKVKVAGQSEGSPETQGGTVCCCGVGTLSPLPQSLGLSITGSCCRNQPAATQFVS